MLLEGARAPDFSVEDAEGTTHSLSAYKGNIVVVFFYPKDDTPGCTIEACEFTRDLPEFKKAGIVLFGVSPDSAESHRKFAKKFKISYSLLVDEDHALAEKYGAWAQKSFMGRKYMGIIRSTFIIGKGGKLVKIYQKVSPLGHSKEILKWIADYAK